LYCSSTRSSTVLFKLDISTSSFLFQLFATLNRYFADKTLMESIEVE